MRSIRMLTLGIVALAAASAGGCSTYHYYDIDVSLLVGGTNGFNPIGNEVGNVQRLRVTMSGADNAEKVFGPSANGLPIGSAGHLGIVEFSTFADSGTLTFTVDAYDSTNLVSNCKVGEGTTSMPASGNTTNTGTLTVNRSSGATFCCSMSTC